TCTSVLQQRAEFRSWRARGRAPGDQFAAGHIRWSKMAAGLSGRLGDFTARYAGPAQHRGHRIIVEDASGGLAHGYRTPLGQELHPEIVIGNKAHARAAMADSSRQYAASTSRWAATPRPRNPKKEASMRNSASASALQSCLDFDQPIAPAKTVLPPIEQPTLFSVAVVDTAGPSHPASIDFSFAGGRTSAASWKGRAQDNIEAIRLLNMLDREGRPAAAAEQEAIAKFIGFGASDLANNVFARRGDE
ncbi:hypothetical protein OY671_008015, partial [Metschnikowia pulcherrima]